MSANIEGKSPHPFWHYAAINVAIFATVIGTAFGMFYRLGFAEDRLKEVTAAIEKLSVDEYRLNALESDVKEIKSDLKELKERR